MLSIHEHLKKIAKEAAHKGLTRTLEKFFKEENLPAQNWPPYVKKEIIEKIPLKEREDYEATWNVENTLKRLKTREGLKTFKQFQIEFKPQPEILDLKTDLSDFDPATKERLKTRGNLKIYEEIKGVPHDLERKEKQRELVKLGLNKEPAIVVETSNGYQLLEGWHRALALIERANKGGLRQFKLKAYVGKEKNRNVIEKFKSFLQREK